jgi:transposase
MQTERAEFSGTEAAFDISAIVACQRDRLPSHRGNVTGDVIRNSTLLAKSMAKEPAKHVIKDIQRESRRNFQAEDKIRILLDKMRGEDSIAELCRREGFGQSL